MSNRRGDPSFFKALVGDFKNKLCLPKAIRTKLVVKGKILLTNPITRRSWLVSVQEDENDLFLCNEWTNFANDNDLQFAEILVFRSSGESEFTVKIFGKNGCEKEYPLEEAQGEDTEFHPGTKHNIPEERSNEEAALMNKMTRNQVEETGHSLTVTFQKSKKCHFYVARWWVEVTSLGEKDRVMLLDPSDKSWPVDIIRNEIGDTYLSTGWSEFCKALWLDTGDTLRFQFVDEDAIRVEIIQRNIDSSDITLEELCVRQRRKKIIAMTGFTSEKPHFSITMRSTYVSGPFMLCLPAPCARTFIKHDHQDIILRSSNGGSWIACCTIQKIQYRLVGKGWRKFASDNKLKENDTCIFELVNRNPIELKVYIIPCNC